ncbi:MAG: hypothetical protein AB7J13_01530 [Pyrinomonadaceae bacterium]
MRTKIFAFAAIAVLLTNIAVFAKSDTRARTAKQLQTAKLVAMLPASDGVVAFDAKRFFNDALPKVLASNQPMLAEVTAKLIEMEGRTGIDLRKFEQVAVGIAFRQVSEKEIDYEPVSIASGDITGGAIAAVSRLAANGTYRTETFAGRTIYIFSSKEAFSKTTSGSKVAGMMNDAIDGLTKDVAVTAMDRQTVVLGSLARVKQTLEGGSKVGADIIALLNAKDAAVLSFAARSPAGGLSKMLPLDNDDFGANIDAIKYLSGSVEVNALGTSLQVLAKTQKAEQAQSLKETIEGLQMLGGAIFGGSKRPDQQVYGRMIKAAKVTQHGPGITLDLVVPQTDIDALIGGMK